MSQSHFYDNVTYGVFSEIDAGSLLSRRDSWQRYIDGMVLNHQWYNESIDGEIFDDAIHTEASGSKE